MRTFRSARWIPGLTIWTWSAAFVFALIRYESDGRVWYRSLHDPWFLVFLCWLGVGPAALVIHLIRAALSPVRADPAVGLLLRGHTIPWLDLQAVRVQRSPASLEAVADGVSRFTRRFLERMLDRHPGWPLLLAMVATAMLIAGMVTAVLLWCILWPLLALSPGTGDRILLHVQGDRSITLHDMSRQEEFFRMIDKHASWAVATHLLVQPVRTGAR